MPHLALWDLQIQRFSHQSATETNERIVKVEGSGTEISALKKVIVSGTGARGPRRATAAKDSGPLRTPQTRYM